jgi:hypothetical protein
LRRISIRAGAAAACLLGLATWAVTSAAGAATSPTAPPASSPVTVATNTSLSAREASLGSGSTDCPAPTSPLQMQCMIIINHDKKSAGTLLRPRSAATKDLTIATALGPADLQAAYNLASASTSATDGVGVTVAVVEAYNDPYIASDLATYRSNWGLSACPQTTTGTGCHLSVFNQNGETSPLPEDATGDNLGWDDETALDAEMISAICPNCSIDVFAANSDDIPDLGTAENSAAKVTKFISNSWGGADYPGESAYDNIYFNHPGVVLDFAAGDYGFGPQYPASSQFVTSVGGTDLTNSSSTTSGYTESVWNGQLGGPSDAATAAGCSAGEPKPSWQTDTASNDCQNRTQNDVAAVADAPYGIDITSSSQDCGPAAGDPGAFGNLQANDCSVEGTSVAAPIITASYALALGTTGPVPDTYPVSYLYQHAGNTSDLNLVSGGSTGTCESTRQYLCNADDSLSDGYNGPAGLGTPNGLGAFQPASGDIVSVSNPGTYDLQAGTHISLPIKAYDSKSGQTLTYTENGLPAGLSYSAATGTISGTLPTYPVDDTVYLTAKDGTGARAEIRFGIVGVKPMSSAYHAGFGEIKLDQPSKCANDGYNHAYVDAPISIYNCQVSQSQNWSYSVPGAPGAYGRISVNHMCLYVLGSKSSEGYNKVGLANCGFSAGELWVLTGQAGEIVNPASGDCLTDPDGSSVNNTQLTVEPCTDDSNQAWTPPASPLTSGVAGKCLAVSGAAISTACTTSAAQHVTLGIDSQLVIGGRCLYAAGAGINDGTAVGVVTCNADSAAQLWFIGPDGQIQNLNAGKCLAIPGNSTANGARLELEDCYGQLGEVWAQS